MSNRIYTFNNKTYSIDNHSHTFTNRKYSRAIHGCVHNISWQAVCKWLVWVSLSSNVISFLSHSINSVTVFFCSLDNSSVNSPSTLLTCACSGIIRNYSSPAFVPSRNLFMRTNNFRAGISVDISKYFTAVKKLNGELSVIKISVFSITSTVFFHVSISSSMSM